jgi:hypothetical protein
VYLSPHGVISLDGLLSVLSVEPEHIVGDIGIVQRLSERNALNHITLPVSDIERSGLASASRYYSGSRILTIHNPATVANVEESRILRTSRYRWSRTTPTLLTIVHRADRNCIGLCSSCTPRNQIMDR